MDGRGIHVSIFVEITSGWNATAPYLYRMEIESRDPDEMPAVSDSWGWNRGCSLKR
jgi:hypothetical protein